QAGDLLARPVGRRARREAARGHHQQADGGRTMNAIRIVLPAVAGALLSLAPIAADLGAQSIADRVSAVRSGTVRMEYAAKEGVCGNGRGSISVRNGNGNSTYSTGSTGSTRQREWE